MTQEQIEAAVTLMAQCMLVLVKDTYTEGKMVRMLDQTGVVVFRSLQDTDIVDSPEVFLEAGTLFRSEAQDREAKVYDMLELGLITPDEAKQAISFRLMPMDLIEKMEALRHANEMLEAVVTFGAPLEVFRGDEDLDTLKSVFKRFMATTAYYALPPARQDQVADAYRAILDQTAAPKAAPGGATPDPQMAPEDSMDEAVQGVNEPILASNEAMAASTEEQDIMAATGSNLMPGG